MLHNAVNETGIPDLRNTSDHVDRWNAIARRLEAVLEETRFCNDYDAANAEDRSYSLVATFVVWVKVSNDRSTHQNKTIVRPLARTVLLWLGLDCFFFLLTLTVFQTYFANGGTTGRK